MFKRLFKTKYKKPAPPIWIQTWTGKKFEFERPAADQIEILDIAHALSHVCRFTGHVNQFYSVAEHCVRVSYLVPREDALAGLLHDASEAYLTDVNKPLKALLGESYARLERIAEEAIAYRFGINPKIPDSVKKADLVMMMTEKRDLFSVASQQFWAKYEHIVPLNYTLKPWTSQQAEERFLARFWKLDQDRMNKNELDYLREAL